MQKLLDSQQGALERVSASYRRGSVQDDWMRRLCVRVISPWLRPTDRLIEIGCSDGLMTQMLAAKVSHVTVVEASKYFVNELQKRGLSNVSVHHAMAESFTPEEKFDGVVLTWVLTHVIDAEQLLKKLKTWLKPDGMIFVAVPNARVLSRQLALHMNLLSDLFALTANDRDHGHVRAYDRARLNSQLDQAGYETLEQSGLMLKPLADFQMDALYANGILSDAHVDGLFSLGREYPDLASALFSVCKARNV